MAYPNKLTEACDLASQVPTTGCRGLLQHSPWLCGNSLTKGLNMAFCTGVIIWASIPRPMMLTLFHNVLVEEGLLEGIEILGKMRFYFPESIGLDGYPVADRFSKWTKSMSTCPANRSGSQAPNQRGLHGRSTADNPGPRLCYSIKSQLMIYDKAAGNLQRVPDSVLRPLGNLWRLRFSQTPVHVDPVTGKQKLQDTPIVCRLRDLQFPEGCIPELFKQASEFATEIVASRAKPLSHSRNLKDEILQNVRLDVHTYPQAKMTRPGTLSLAHLPRTDMISSVHVVFSDIEKGLGSMKNPLYTHVYDNQSGLFKSKRVDLTWGSPCGSSRGCWRGIADSHRGRTCLFLITASGRSWIPTRKSSARRMSVQRRTTDVPSRVHLDLIIAHFVMGMKL